VKNWKARCFVAYNAADNYKITYHDGTTEAGKLKGTIHCAGYRAYEFNSDDIAEFGEAGIKLVPWSSRRRTWWIKCADDQERKEWMSVFENACYKATAPRDKDECIATAFDVTLQKLRWHFWFWGYYSDAGSEDERLGEFILDLLDRNIINEIIGNIAENAGKPMVVDLIRKTIGSTVKGVCSSAWISSVTAVRSLSESIKSSVSDLIGPVLDKQKEFKAKIVRMISSTIDPFLADKGGALLKPVLNVVFKPVTDAFVLVVRGFHTHMSNKISANEFSSARFDSAINQSDYQMDWWSGPLHQAYELSYRMYTSDMATVASLFTGGMSPYTVYCMVREKLQLIAHRAVTTFGSLAKSISEGEMMSVLSHVTGLLFHDCLLMTRSVLAAVLSALIASPITEMVISPCKEVIAPLQEAVDSIPVPGLSMLLDLNAMMQEVVTSIQDNAIEAIIAKSVGQIKQTFDHAQAELGISAVKLK
jgi:Fe-S cluster biogenesis protein NfuA